MIRLLVWLGALVAVAHADHDHGAHVSHDPGTQIEAKLALVAARYTTETLLGDYQGITPSVRYGNGPVSFGANASFYRLTSNGATYYGPGDVVVDGQLQLVGGHPASAGASLGVSFPTGSQRRGLGMGHVMLMPSMWGVYMVPRVTFVGMVGYGRALGDRAHAHHTSGGPIVDPMNLSEITFSGQADYSLARALTASARVIGGVPVAGDGITRVIGGVRIGWTEGRLTTTAEIQGGFVGDPFEVRGILATALKL